jgi:replicative DNA helicase
MSVTEMPSHEREFERTPPHDLAAEQCVLGSMLLSQTAIAEVIEMVQTRDFYRPAHQTVFDRVLDLYGRGDPVDAITVKDELLKRGELSRIGDAPYLHTLVASVPTAANAGYYAKIVQEKAVLRRLVEVGTRIAQLGYSTDGADADALLDRAQAEVYAIADKRSGEDYAPLSDIMPGALDEIEAIGSRGGQMVGVPTGFTDLDALTNGLHPGQMIIIAARPAIGKCLAGSTLIVDARTGDRIRIDEFVRRGRAGQDVRVHALNAAWQFEEVRPSDFLDNGVRSVRRLTTQLGRTVTATPNHPFFTLRGWVPLEELRPGDRIAAPREIRTQANEKLPDALVALTAYLIGDGNLANATPRLTAFDPKIKQDAEHWAAEFGVSARSLAMRPCRDETCPEIPSEHRHPTALSFKTPAGRPNPLTQRLSAWGLMGLDAHHKHVPDEVFRLSERQIALFLSRLFATDGWASVQTASGQPQIGYSTVSERLARDVAHLLLRLGITGRVCPRTVAYKGQRRPTWTVYIHDIDQIRRFAQLVGIFSKEQQVDRVLEVIGERVAKPNVDLIPGEIWEQILDEMGDMPMAELSRRTGRADNHKWHVGQQMSRHRLMEIAKALDSAVLRQIADSDLIWDKIVSIEDAGQERVYDLTVPIWHNFVANDLVVHNSTLALDLARAAAIKHQLATVVFSLEMGRNEITMRLLSAEARVALHAMRSGSMNDEDWTRLARRMSEVAEAPLFIDDSPNMSMMEIRAKCRRLKQQHDLRLVIIDYLQLMQSGKRVESRQVEVSEFSRSLKLLAKELEVPVIALSQLNRGPEQRTDKKPMVSDLRESGSIEQDADMVILLHREDAYEKESPRAGEADLIVAKHRNGPTATVTVAFQGHYSRFVDMAH